MNWFDKVYETVMMAVVPNRAYNLGNDYLGAAGEVKRLRESIKTRITNRDFNGALALVGTACLEYKRASSLRDRLMLTDQGRKKLLDFRSTYSDTFENQDWIPYPYLF